MRDRLAVVTGASSGIGLELARFFEAEGFEVISVAKDDPVNVARAGYEAMMEGKERVVAASLMTKVQGRAGRVLPDSAKAKLHGKVAKPKH